MPKKPTQRPYADPLMDPRIQRVNALWSTLDKFGRGDQINALHADYTLKELESVLPCSEKRLRDFEIFGRIPSKERYKLKRAGVKKILKWERRRKQFQLLCKRISKGKQARQLGDKLTRRLVRWTKETLTMWTWDPFFEQVLTNPHTHALIKNHAPSWEECDPEGNRWDSIIEETRPPGDPENPPPNPWDDHVFHYYEVWFARWYQRCMPVQKIAEPALVRARTILRETLKDKGQGEDWYSR